MFHSRTFRSIVILIVALVFASTAYALAAQNTIADGGQAGYGTGGISGYTVSNVKYLSTPTPLKLQQLNLNLPLQARLRLA